MANRITLKNIRISYANFFEPRPSDPNNPDSPLKYSTSLIIPKDHPQVEYIEAKIKEAAEAKFGTKADQVLKKGNPLRDGDEDREGDPAYANSYFLNSSSKRKPQVVDRQLNHILDESEIWSGCYVNISIAFFGYEVNGNKGVGVGLNNVQLFKEGPRLGGAPNAEEEFEAVDDDDDDVLD